VREKFSQPDGAHVGRRHPSQSTIPEFRIAGREKHQQEKYLAQANRPTFDNARDGKNGSPQESDSRSISCGFLHSLKSEEFDIGHGDPFGLQQ